MVARLLIARRRRLNPMTPPCRSGIACYIAMDFPPILAHSSVARAAQRLGRVRPPRLGGLADRAPARSLPERRLSLSPKRKRARTRKCGPGLILPMEYTPAFDRKRAAARGQAKVAAAGKVVPLAVVGR